MKKHWSVLICCCGLAAASIGISINSSGVFYTPVSKSLHMLRGTFSMHMTLFLWQLLSCHCLYQRSIKNFLLKRF